MTPPIANPIAPYLLLAELGAALFGGTAASAEERITGAVRMAGPESVRRADPAPEGAEARPAREATAARSIDEMAARHN
jgi:hypothetical protein